MKKAFLLLFMITALGMSACSRENVSDNQPDMAAKPENDTEQTEKNSTLIENTEELEESETKAMRKIRILLGTDEMILEMEENSASRNLIDRLPLTMSFQDYNATEKISYLEEELDISDAPDSCTPSVGMLTYYAPWGNLAFFYQNFRNSPQLIPLGKIISGEEYLVQLDGYSEVTLELYPE